MTIKSSLAGGIQFKVRVNTHKGGAYWTWSGCTAFLEQAAIFTIETLPDLFVQSFHRDNIEVIMIEEGQND